MNNPYASACQPISESCSASDSLDSPLFVTVILNTNKRLTAFQCLILNIITRALTLIMQ